jgi:beta-glucosidase
VSAELSLEQKASLLAGRDFWSTQAIDEAGIPAVVLTDGPHGVRLSPGGVDQLGLANAAPATCFPPAVAVGNSWDPDVAERIGAAVAAEARALGVHVVLGPGVNIKRSPLCGRNFEYYSEDPLLAGVLGSGHVRGLQRNGVGASVKHFAANNQETDRMRISSDVDERTLREIYLPAFERIVLDAEPATVMCSYNRVNGVYASENYWLLTKVLRDEWGYAGVVVSDWGAVQDRVAALAAGLDLEMPGPATSGVSDLVAAVRAGDLDEAVIDRSLERVHRLTDLVRPKADGFDADAHHRLARELASECAVLMKNNDEALPLSDNTAIAVVGAFASEPRYQGGGSSHITPTRVDVAIDEIRSLAEARGCTLVEPAKADVAVVFAGLAEADESEGFDRTSIELPPDQVELIRSVAAASRRTVVVLSHGGVLSLEGWHDEVDAILDCFLLGQAAGGAIADLLFGVANPAGHLAESIPLQLADTPSFANFPGEQGHVRYGEGVLVGYRWFTTVNRAVRYPFGHGLSYTTFVTSEVNTEVTGDAGAKVSATVTNTGGRSGSHVVQVYVSTDTGPVRRPARELRGFAKIALAPGESSTVTIDLDRRAFAYYDIREADWVVPAGEYRVQVCADADTVLAENAVDLVGDGLVPTLDFESSVEEALNHPEAGPELIRIFVGPDGAADGISETLIRLAGSMPLQKVMQIMGRPLPAEFVERYMPTGAGSS